MVKNSSTHNEKEFSHHIHKSQVLTFQMICHAQWKHQFGIFCNLYCQVWSDFKNQSF